MALKSIDRSTKLAFSPDGTNLACGTAAGTIDGGFSGESALETFSIGYANGARQMQSNGNRIISPDMFNSLVWGEGENGGNIIGGLGNGLVAIWQRNMQESEPAAQMDMNKGAVKGLDVNNHSQNIFASGGEGGIVCVWDIENLAEPNLCATPTESGEPVTKMAWNRQVEYILASADSSGVVSVFDVRYSKKVFELSNPAGRRRCSSVTWSPAHSTRIITSSDDDRCTSIHEWDLRKASVPCNEFRGHSKGVTDLDWCAFDHSLFASAGKDGKLFLWDTHSSQPIYSLPVVDGSAQKPNGPQGGNVAPHGNASSNPTNPGVLSLRWSPKTPGMLAISSVDGGTLIYNTLRGASSTTSRPPKWLRKPIGLCVGFDGSIYTTKGWSVVCHKLSMDDDGGAKGEVNEGEAAEGQRIDDEFAEDEETQMSRMKQMCNTKSDMAMSKGGNSNGTEEAWRFVSALFSNDTRRGVLETLGYGNEVERANAHAEEAMKEEERDSNEEIRNEHAMNWHNDNGDDEEVEEAEDSMAFFDSLVNTGKEGKGNGAKQSQRQGEQETTTSSEMEPRATTRQHNDEGGFGNAGSVEDNRGGDREIERAMVVGDWMEAARAAMENGRTDDALILASCGGERMFGKLRRECVSRKQGRIMSIVSAVAENGLERLVRVQPASMWEETLALICTHSRDEKEMRQLAASLAERLERHGDTKSATMCNICAGNADRVINHLMSMATSTRAASLKTIGEVASVASAMAMACSRHKIDVGETASGLIATHAQMLASQGEGGRALRSIRQLPINVIQGTRAEELKLRLEKSMEPASGGKGKDRGNSDNAGRSVGNVGQQQTQQTPLKNQSATTVPPQQQQMNAQAHRQQPMWKANPVNQTQAFQVQGQQQQQQGAGFTPQQPQPQASAQFNPMAQPQAQSQAQLSSTAQPQAQPQFSPTAQQQPQQQPQFNPAAQQQPHFNPTAPQQQQQKAQAAFNSTAPPPQQQVAFNPTTQNRPTPQTATAEPQQQTATQSMQQQPNETENSSLQSHRGETPKPQREERPPAGLLISTANIDPSKFPTDGLTAIDPSSVQDALLSIQGLMKETVNGYANVPQKKKEIDDADKKVGRMHWRIEKGHVGEKALQGLVSLGSAIGQADPSSALHCITDLAQKHWSELGECVPALRRLIKLRQNME